MELTYSQKCIIARNENEIKEIKAKRSKLITEFCKCGIGIRELRNQNRELKGRGNEQNVQSTLS